MPDAVLHTLLVGAYGALTALAMWYMLFSKSSGTRLGRWLEDGPMLLTAPAKVVVGVAAIAIVTVVGGGIFGAAVLFYVYIIQTYGTG